MSWLALAQLLRLPNAFTALADIALASLAAGTLGQRPGIAALLGLASVCLYSAGMALNDYFDRDEDARARPFRPIPSGRISARTALSIGLGLLSAGVLTAGLVSWLVGLWAPLVLAVLVAGAVLLYDGVLKPTALAPVSMGACRFLNVLLGASVADPELLPWIARLHLAGSVGVYIVGVTWFARREEGVSDVRDLMIGAGLMLAGLLIGVLVPIHVPPGTASSLYVCLLAGFGLYLGLPILRAIQKPQPQQVQTAVKRAVLGLVGFDAVLATAFVGTPGLLIVLLLPPALWLGRRVYST